MMNRNYQDDFVLLLEKLIYVHIYQVKINTGQRVYDELWIELAKLWIHFFYLSLKNTRQHQETTTLRETDIS